MTFYSIYLWELYSAKTTCTSNDVQSDGLAFNLFTSCTQLYNLVLSLQSIWILKYCNNVRILWSKFFISYVVCIMSDASSEV